MRRIVIEFPNDASQFLFNTVHRNIEAMPELKMATALLYVEKIEDKEIEETVGGPING